MKNNKETVGLMLCTARIHRNHCERFVSSLGVHDSQHRVLMYLSDKTASSQKEIAAAFHVSSAAIAVTLKKLENGGFIRRVQEKDDMRQNRIEITKSGLEVVNRSKNFFEDLDKKMFEGISDTERETFISCLEKMQKNLKCEG